MVDLIENLMCHFPVEGVELEGSAVSAAATAGVVEAEDEAEVVLESATLLRSPLLAVSLSDRISSC